MSTPSILTLPPNFNYAKAFGINSTPAAILFAIFYVPLFPFFLKKSFARPTFVYTVLSIFCIVRLTAFVIRAVLAGNDSAGENLGLLIADEVLLGVGFAGLLYSSYTLVLDRSLLHSKSTMSTSSHPLARIIHHHHRSLFRIALSIGVILGVVASTRLSNGSHGMDNGTKTLHEAGTVIVLLLTILLLAQTMHLLRNEMQNPSYNTPITPGYDDTAYPPADTNQSIDPSLGQSHGAYMLCLVSLLLLVRVVFNTVTVNNLRRQNEEQLWYPFVALPEILAVTLFIIPGLVPLRAELPR